MKSILTTNAVGKYALCMWLIWKNRTPKLAKLRHVNLNSYKVHSTQIIRWIRIELTFVSVFLKLANFSLNRSNSVIFWPRVYKTENGDRDCCTSKSSIQIEEKNHNDWYFAFASVSLKMHEYQFNTAQGQFPAVFQSVSIKLNGKTT